MMNWIKQTTATVRKITFDKTSREGIETPTTVKVGDTVGFKCDHEQYGKITEILRDRWTGQVVLALENPDGFGGSYLRYATTTNQNADRCWVD